MGNAWGFAIAATVVACVIWLVAMPRGTRGRAWHFALAPVPPAALLLHASLPPGPAQEILASWLVAGAAGWAVLLVTWIAGTAIRNHGMMDVAYPIAPMVIAWTAAMRAEHPLSFVAWAALAMVTLWGVRLSLQTLRDNYPHEREPYAAWRARGGRQWIWWSLFQVYCLQGVVLWIWSLPLVLAVDAPMNEATLGFGVAVWLVGFTLQTVADAQLAVFRKNPANRGQILRTGAWAIVRQPNYLGESLMWWAYALCALAHPYGLIGLLGPIFQTWFMGFGSAGPDKESHMRRTRGEAWNDYCARTPRFFPWPRSRRADPQRD